MKTPGAPTHPLSAIRPGPSLVRNRNRRTYMMWETTADMINAIPQPEVRALVANHAAQYFNRTVPQFNCDRWAGKTGGKLSGPITLEMADK